MTTTATIDARADAGLMAPIATAAPKISIVIPLYNEEDSIPHLHEALDAAIANYGRPAEVIIIDDGSRDRSFVLLKEIAQRDPRFTIIRFRRNFGQTAGFAAGFAQARGEFVITMDADLQNDPMDIPLLMAKADEGYDIVSGWRKNRQDRWLDRKLPSMLANRLISNVTDVRLHDYGCSLKAYRTRGAQAGAALRRAAPLHSRRWPARSAPS
jgi:glycosyltransferase involved in cell wall biosynthesis